MPTETPTKMTEKIKVAELDKFDGSDTSLATVTVWALSIEKYMKPEAPSLHSISSLKPSKIIIKRFTETSASLNTIINTITFLKFPFAISYIYCIFPVRKYVPRPIR